MSGISGYPHQSKLIKPIDGYSDSQTNTKSQYLTIEPSIHQKLLASTANMGAFRLHASAKTAEANTVSPNRLLKSTAHGASVGDIVRFELLSANSYFEAAITGVPDANFIILGTELPNNIVTGDEFFILRYVTPTYSANGTITVTSTTPTYVSAGYNAPLDASSSNITNAAYTTLVASPAAGTQIEIFNTTGKYLVLAVGAAASEVNKLIIPPSGLLRQDFVITAAVRLSVKSLNDTADIGFVGINIFV